MKFRYHCTPFTFTVCAFGGHKNSTFYVKSALSPEGRYCSVALLHGQAIQWLHVCVSGICCLGPAVDVHSYGR